MKTLSQHVCAALVGIAFFSSCSRPVAYFQRGPVQHYGSAKTEIAPGVSASEITAPTETPAPVSEPSVATSTPAQQIAQAQSAVTQLDAYVRNDSKLASNKKLTKRMERIKSMLNSANAKILAAPATTTSAKKMTLMERVVLKKIDKKIKNHVAPNRPADMSSTVWLGLVVAIVAALVLILGATSVLAVLAWIALVGGLVLALLGLLQS